jgi:hypothetical protein
MDRGSYERWWQLHLRAARGEELDDTERAVLEAGLGELDAQETVQWGEADVTILRSQRAEVERLEAVHALLQARSNRLDRQIWMLEGAYMMLTGIELGGQGYAASPL